MTIVSELDWSPPPPEKRIADEDRWRVNVQQWHLVQSRKRAKKLLRRGENIKYSTFYGCWIWDFLHRTT